MGYMKELWARQEQERAEKAQLRAAARANAFSGLPSYKKVASNTVPTGHHTTTHSNTNRRVSDCIRDIALKNLVRPTCPACRQRHWTSFSLQDDPICDGYLAVLNSVWECSNCRTRQELRACLNLSSADHNELCSRVTIWLNNGLPQAPLGPITVTYTPTLKLPLSRPLLATKESTCEADKPIGTRDPDKFLKEQQNKLWEGMV